MATPSNSDSAHVIGGGLAGSEAAWQIAEAGALINHITGGHLAHDETSGSRSFQPMNVNFALFPPIDIPPPPDGKRLKGKAKGLARKKAISARALADIDAWLRRPAQAAAE